MSNNMKLDFGPSTDEPNATIVASLTQCNGSTGQYLMTKIVLVAGFGTTIAALGIAGNLFVVAGAWFVKKYSNYLLLTLACCDALFATTYILVFSVEIWCEILESHKLVFLWINNVRHFYAAGHIAKAVTNYLVIMVALERYISLKGSRPTPEGFSNRTVAFIIIGIFSFSVLIRGVSYFELIVSTRNCSGLWNLTLVASGLMKSPVYATYFRIWFIHVVQVFVPFFALVGLNGCILYRCSKVLRQKRILKLCKLEHLADKRRKGLMLSTRCLLVLVCNQILAILFSFVIVMFEYFDNGFLKDHPYFYAVCRDMISIFAITNTVIRFGIHLASGGLPLTKRINSWCLSILCCQPGLRHDHTLLSSNRTGSVELVQGFGLIPTCDEDVPAENGRETVVIANISKAQSYSSAGINRELEDML